MSSTGIESLSNEFVAIVEQAKRQVVCVAAGKAAPRSGLLIGNGELLTVARVAETGEKVPIHIGADEAAASVVGFDPASGIALLKLEGDAASVNEDSAVLQTGEEIPAVGSLTVTVACPIPDDHEARLGMIRCVGGQTRTAGGRRIERYFQTDSARFRGFSGSVVYSASGTALGMTMPVHRREEGFIVPMVELLEIADQLRNGGSMGTGYLGIQATSVDLPEQQGEYSVGLLITGVEPESPAEQAGLHVGTFIVRVGDTKTPDIESLYDALSGLHEGEEVKVGIVKGGAIEEVRVTVTLRAR